jgi:hypothetical protein
MRYSKMKNFTKDQKALELFNFFYLYNYTVSADISDKWELTGAAGSENIIYKSPPLSEKSANGLAKIISEQFNTDRNGKLVYVMESRSIQGTYRLFVRRSVLEEIQESNFTELFSACQQAQEAATLKISNANSRDPEIWQEIDSILSKSLLPYLTSMKESNPAVSLVGNDEIVPLIFFKALCIDHLTNNYIGFPSANNEGWARVQQDDKADIFYRTSSLTKEQADSLVIALRSLFNNDNEFDIVAVEDRYGYRINLKESVLKYIDESSFKAMLQKVKDFHATAERKASSKDQAQKSEWGSILLSLNHNLTNFLYTDRFHYIKIGSSQIPLDEKIKLQILSIFDKVDYDHGVRFEGNWENHARNSTLYHSPPFYNEAEAGNKAQQLIKIFKALGIEATDKIDVCQDRDNSKHYRISVNKNIFDSLENKNGERLAAYIETLQGSSVSDALKEECADLLKILQPKPLDSPGLRSTPIASAS